MSDLREGLARFLRENHQVEPARSEVLSHAALSYLSTALPGFRELVSGEAVVVPREPNDDMKLAGGMIPDAFKGTSAARGNADRVYRAMLAASPWARRE